VSSAFGSALCLVTQDQASAAPALKSGGYANFTVRRAVAPILLNDNRNKLVAGARRDARLCASRVQAPRLACKPNFT
jgi:hypothetical protein